MKELEKKLLQLSNKIEELEKTQYKMVHADLFNGSFALYLESLFGKQFYYLYDLLRIEDNERREDIQRRILQTLTPPDYHSIQYLQEIVRILFRRFNLICRENDLKYWFELGSLASAHRLGDINPDADHGNVGMPLNDILHLSTLLADDPDFYVDQGFSSTQSGFIKMYRFKLRKCNDTWLDIFSYHYADASTLRNKRKHWDDFLALKKVYASECLGLQQEGIFSLNILNKLRNQNKLRDQIVQKFIILQDELIAPNRGKEALFWGIENFTYGKPNILNCQKLFPLADMKLWGDLFTVSDAKSYLLAERKVNLLDFPNMDFKSSNKMQQQKEEELRQIIATYGGNARCASCIS